MKNNCFSTNYKHSNIIILILLTFLSLSLSSCNDSEDLEYEVQAFQQQVDSILVNVIVPKKDSLHAQISNGKALNQKSIDIAYQVIPINTAQFLISSQSDTLLNSLKLFKSRKINADALKEKLDYSKFYVDSILISNVMQ